MATFGGVTAPPFFPLMSYNRVHRTNQARGQNLQGVKMDHRLDPDTKQFLNKAVYILAAAIVVSALIKSN